MTVMHIVGVTNLDCHSLNILGYVTNIEGINVYVLDMLAFIIGMLNFVGCVMNFEDNWHVYHKCVAIQCRHAECH